MATEKKINSRITLKNDSTANWTAAQDKVLLKGELGIEFKENGKAKIKVGDGTTTWQNLTYAGGDDAKTFQVSSLDEIVDTELAVGDIAIVKTAIYTDAENAANNKYSYTGYVYDGSAWTAMDGNYSADNVYFGDDMLVTKEIGYITLTNGQGTIPSKGKNLAEVFEAMFVKEQNPSTTQPSVGITFSQAKSYEVGTVVSPTYSASFNAGSYSYGPATGVTVTSWEISDTAGNAASTASGSFADVTVADNTNYKITAKANHTAGAIPLTNKKNEYAAGQIAAGSKSKVSGAITGYRNSFYGTATTKDAVDSAAIRALTKSGKALSNGNSFTVNIPVGAVRVIFAYPATLRDVSSVKDVNGLNAEIKSAFNQTTVTVEGANGYAGIEYKVYTTDFAEAVSKANSYTVKI